MLGDVGRGHAEHAHERRAEVERVDEERLALPAAVAQEAGRAPDGAAVEDPDRDQVEQVEEEAEVGEREQQVRALRLADQVADERGGAAEDRPGDRDPRGLPRIAARVLHVGAEERDEHRQLRVQPLALRLEEVAHLVEQDQHDEADRELPAPDQRVAADRDEDRRELDEDERELRECEHRRDDRREELLQAPAPVGAARLDRVVAAVVEIGIVGAGIHVGHEPRPIHSSPPS